MVGSRTLTAVLGLAVGLAVSVAAWVMFGTIALFLFLPFVPFLFWRPGQSGPESVPDARACPVCGFRTNNHDYAYCPRDGHRLEAVEGE